MFVNILIKILTDTISKILVPSLATTAITWMGVMKGVWSGPEIAVYAMVSLATGIYIYEYFAKQLSAFMVTRDPEALCIGWLRGTQYGVRPMTTSGRKFDIALENMRDYIHHAPTKRTPH